METGHLAPKSKIDTGNAFADHIFWKSVMVPTLQAQIAGKYAELRTCALGEVKAVRRELEALERFIEMPKMIIESARQDLMLEQYSREQRGEAEDEKE